MATSTQWQLTRQAATRYEQIVVPNILGPFAKLLVESAALQPGMTVLDVGCGTGAAARFAAERVGSAGRVVGVDVNAGMIAEAKSLPAPKGAAIEWREQSAYQLPLLDQSVDVVLSAQMLQFLQDRVAGLKEMHRVLKPGGLVAVSVWCDKQQNPYFLAQMETITAHIGEDVAAGLKAGLNLATASAIEPLFQEAGFSDIEVTVQQLDLPLPDLKEFIPRHISATPLAAGYNAAPASAQQAVIDEMISQLAQYETNGRVQVPFRSNIAKARK
jgi:ubiquinone/menaquinone biosynthesis C-methylase UbiE